MGQPINPAALERLRAVGGQNLVQRMVELFLKNVPQRFAAGRDGLAAGDLQAVEHAVHSIKSSAGNIGAEELMELAGQAEAAAEGGQTDRLPALIDAIDAALAAVSQQLQAELEEDAT